MNTVLLNHPNWRPDEYFDVLRLRGGSIWFGQRVMVFHMYNSGLYQVSRMRISTAGWEDWKELDLFAAQAVVDHIFTPRRVKLWRWLRGYFERYL